MGRGYLCSVEGQDGAGKSGHIEPLAKVLREHGHDVVVTREPGGTALGEKLRQMLLHEPMHALTETLLMFAARKEHLELVIKPALEKGCVVITDRFTDSSVAYQGGGKNVSLDVLGQLERMVQTHNDVFITPDLTLWFDLSPSVAAARLAGAREPDKFESEGQQFFQRVRDAYAMRYEKSAGRIVRIEADAPRDAVFFAVLQAVKNAGLMDKSNVG